MLQNYCSYCCDFYNIIGTIELMTHLINQIPVLCVLSYGISTLGYLKNYLFMVGPIQYFEVLNNEIPLSNITG
jgi:hypothetical protein